MKIIVRKCRDQIAVVAVMVYSKLDDNDYYLNEYSLWHTFSWLPNLDLHL